MMRTRIVTGLIGLSIVVGLVAPQAASADDDAVKKVLATLKGEWKLTSRTENGEETPAETIRNRVMTVEEGKYTIRDGKEEYISATFKIDPSKDPRSFDVTLTSDGGSKGMSQQGIYKLDGDTLTICLADFDEKRPTDFTAKKGSNRILVTYKKKKS